MMIRLTDLLILIAVFAAGLLLLASPAILMERATKLATPPSRILVIYTADWCEPCRRLKADIKNHPEVLGGMVVEYRDGAEADRVPDIRLMDGNVLVRQKVGYTDLKSFSEWLNADVL